jgi:glycogen synthase
VCVCARACGGWLAQAQRNGFTFDGADTGSLHGALDRAIRLFREEPATWRTISTRNMKVGVCAGMYYIL